MIRNLVIEIDDNVYNFLNKLANDNKCSFDTILNFCLNNGFEIVGLSVKGVKLYE